MKKTAKKATGKKSRDKGQRGERAVAKLLSAWWGADFTRTPMSGGFHTKKFRDEWNASGDVVTPADFPFSVEVKWQEDWTLDQILTAPKCIIWEWWRQCASQCPEGKTPLLVFKRNNWPWFCMMYEMDWDGLIFSSDLAEDVFAPYIIMDGTADMKDWQIKTTDDVPSRYVVFLFKDLLSIPKKKF